ncbi:MAG: response regulator transcription factor [Candidatus Omnitrophica bacterium]|nr:response regulator transcription factor [Candidatus Omnitrophota bacterium]
MADGAKKILIIEDDQGYALMLQKLLVEKGYNVLLVYDTVFGTRAARTEKPDLVILDIGLPGGGGLNVLENLRMSTFTSNLPVIILSATSEEETKQKAFDKGAIEYIEKPFSIPDLLKVVSDIVGA